MIPLRFVELGSLILDLWTKKVLVSVVFHTVRARVVRTSIFMLSHISKDVTLLTEASLPALSNKYERLQHQRLVGAQVEHTSPGTFLVMFPTVQFLAQKSTLYCPLSYMPHASFLTHPCVKLNKRKEQYD